MVVAVLCLAYLSQIDHATHVHISTVGSQADSAVAELAFQCATGDIARTFQTGQQRGDPEEGELH